MARMPSSLEIAQETSARLGDRGLGLEPDEYDLGGKYKARSTSPWSASPTGPTGSDVTALRLDEGGRGRRRRPFSLTQGSSPIGRRVALPREVLARRRSSGSRAARQAAATRRSSPWRT